MGVNVREEFEKVIIELGYVPVWDGDGYLYEEVQVAWQAWQAARESEGGSVPSLLGLSAFEVKAMAQELQRAAHEHSDGDDDYPLDVQIIDQVIDDDGSVISGQILCIRDSDYPEEGVYTIPNSQEVRDRYSDLLKKQSESEGGEAVGLRHALQRLDPISFNNFDELLGEMQRNGITCAPRPDKWIPCSERLPTEADEDERHDLWTCLKDVNGKMHVARNNAAFVEMFAQQRDATKFWWMPTGLTRPAPPEQESE